MEITNDIRAQVYRELADQIGDDYMVMSGDLRTRADKYDPPRPEPGPIVFEDGTRGMILAEPSSPFLKKGDIISEYGELIEFGEEIPWTRARIVESDEVTLTQANAEEIVRTLYELGRPMTAEVLDNIIREQEKLR